MSSSNSNRARKLSLYCPDLDKEVTNFLLTPSMNFDDMIVSIQAALGYHDSVVWPLDINGEPFYDTDEDIVFDLASIQDGEKLLIKLRERDRFTSPLDLEVVLYLEEKDPDALPTTLRQIPADAKRIHMEKLRRRDAVARKNICRIVLPHSEVMELIDELDNTSLSDFERTYSIKNSQKDIEANWRIDIKEKTNHLTNDPRCLALINIFSQALSGQHYLGEGFIIAARNARIAAGGPSEPKLLQEEDVFDAIQNVYEAADAMGSTWDGSKDNKAIDKRATRRKAYKARKKGEKAVEEANADAEYMGEDAAEAAYPGKSKGKAVDKLAGRLEKTMLPDNYMDDTDDDGDDYDDDDKDDLDYEE